MALRLPLNPVILQNPVIAHKMREIREKYLSYSFVSNSSPLETIIWSARSVIEDYTHRQFWVVERDTINKKSRNLLYSEVMAMNLWTGDCIFFMNFTDRVDKDSWLRISYESAYKEAQLGDITEHEKQAISYFMECIKQLP